VLGVICWIVIDNKIEDAKWLTNAEKKLLLQRLAEEPKSDAVHSFRDALRQPSTITMSLIYLVLASGIYGLVFWMPQLIKTAGTDDTFIIGLITVIPYLSAAIGMILIGRSSDRTGERRWHLAGCALAGASLCRQCLLRRPDYRAGHRFVGRCHRHHRRHRSVSGFCHRGY